MSEFEDFLNENSKFWVEDLLEITGDTTSIMVRTQRIDRAITKCKGDSHWDNALFADAQAFDMSISSMQLLGRDSSYNFGEIIGLGCTGCIYAAAIAYRLSKPFTIIPDIPTGISKISKHERALIVSGSIAVGDKEEIVAHAIEDLGGSVWRIIALIDYNKDGGKQRLKDLGYDVKTVMTYPH